MLTADPRHQESATLGSAPVILVLVHTCAAAS